MTEKDFYFDFEIIVKNFVKDQYWMLCASGMHFEFATVQIPHGFYDAEMLCNILNKKIEQFVIQFYLEKSKMVLLTWNMFLEYWFLLTKSPAFEGSEINKWTKSNQNIYANYPFWDVEIKLHLSTSLAFMLGFDEDVMKQTMPMSTKAVEYGVMNGQHVVDKSAGLNFMFVDCNKIENVAVGFEHRQMVLIALLKWYDPRDDHMVETYSPVNHERKLISRMIDSMHFRILDIENNIWQWQNHVQYCHLQGVQIQLKIFFLFFSGTNAYINQKRMLHKISMRWFPWSTLEFWWVTGEE